MRIGSRVVALASMAACLGGGVAFAGPDPVVDMAIEVGRRAAPEGKRYGEVWAGVGELTDWNIELRADNCFTFAGAAGPPIQKLYLYIWDPGGSRVVTEKPKLPQVSAKYCPTVSGMFHVQLKTGEKNSNYRMVIFSEKPAPQPAAPPPPPPGKAPPPQPAGPAPLPDVPCHDSGDQEGVSAMVLSCDCKGMTASVDGQNVQAGVATSIRVDNLSPGCHHLKIDVVTGIFKMETWWNSKVKLAPNAESRFFIKRGSLDAIGRSKLAPQAPPPPQVNVENVSDAIDYVKEAIEYNNDEDSRCASKVGGKLEACKDLLQDVRNGVAPVDRAIGKLQDTMEYAQDECPKRVSEGIRKKLNRALDKLRR